VSFYGYYIIYGRKKTRVRLFLLSSKNHHCAGVLIFHRKHKISTEFLEFFMGRIFRVDSAQKMFRDNLA